MRYALAFLFVLLFASCGIGGSSYLPSDGTSVTPAPSDSSYPDTTGIVYEPITSFQACERVIPREARDDAAAWQYTCDCVSGLVTNDIAAPYHFPFPCFYRFLFCDKAAVEHRPPTVEYVEEGRVKHREEILRANPYGDRDGIVGLCAAQQWSHVSGDYLRVGEETPFTVEASASGDLSNDDPTSVTATFNEEQVKCDAERDPLRLVCEQEWGAEMVEVKLPKVTLGISHGDEQFTVVTP